MAASLILKLRAHWDEILSHGQPLVFHKDQALFYEGHRPYGIFVVLSGSLHFTSNESKCSGESMELFPKGRVLGLDHLVPETPFCCTGIADNDCQVVFISKASLEPYLH